MSNDDLNGRLRLALKNHMRVTIDAVIINNSDSQYMCEIGGAIGCGDTLLNAVNDTLSQLGGNPGNPSDDRTYPLKPFEG